MRKKEKKSDYRLPYQREEHIRVQHEAHMEKVKTFKTFHTIT